MEDEAYMTYDAERYGEGVKFERIRRITGYLVGDVSHWNDR